MHTSAHSIQAQILHGLQRNYNYHKRLIAAFHRCPLSEADHRRGRRGVHRVFFGGKLTKRLDMWVWRESSEAVLFCISRDGNLHKECVRGGGGRRGGEMESGVFARQHFHNLGRRADVMVFRAFIGVAPGLTASSPNVTQCTIQSNKNINTGTHTFHCCLSLLLLETCLLREGCLRATHQFWWK